MIDTVLFPKRTKRLTVIVPAEHNETIEDVAKDIRKMSVPAQQYDGYAPRRQIEIIRMVVKDSIRWQMTPLPGRTVPPWQYRVIVTASGYVLRELSNMLMVGEHAKRGTPLPSAEALGYDAEHRLTADDLDVYTLGSGGEYARVAVSDTGFVVNVVEDLIARLSESMQTLCRDAASAGETR
jgi:hypothetical protein